MVRFGWEAARRCPIPRGTIGWCAEEPPATVGRMAPPSVVVVGSINVDFIVHAARLPGPGEMATNGRLERQGGGKSANQALAAARSGVPTILIAALGDDDLAPEAVRALLAAKVDVGRCVRLPGVSTAVALIAVDPSGENQIVVASGATGLLDGDMVEEALTGLVPARGSICLVGFEVGDTAVMAAARWAAALGLRLVLNPAPARIIPSELLALGPVVTPNRSEAALLTGLSKDAEASARVLAGWTGAEVVVTLGSEGALLLEAADGPAELLPAYPVATVDSTGAGDAFSGVLAAGLAAGLSMARATRRAMAAAALSTTQPGAQAGMPGCEAIDLLVG